MKLLTLASSLAVLAPFFGVAYAQVFDPDQGQGSVQWDPAKIGTNKTTNETYSNPVMTTNVGDPWMIKYSSDGEDWYLLTYSTNRNITLRRSKYMTDNWDNAEEVIIFKPEPEGKDAPGSR